MGFTGEVNHKVLRLIELAKANTKFPRFRDTGKHMVWICVGCNDIIPNEVAFKGDWCNTCWGVLRLEAGYDR